MFFFFSEASDAAGRFTEKPFINTLLIVFPVKKMIIPHNYSVKKRAGLCVRLSACCRDVSLTPSVRRQISKARL